MFQSRGPATGETDTFSPQASLLWEHCGKGGICLLGLRLKPHFMPFTVLQRLPIRHDSSHPWDKMTHTICQEHCRGKKTPPKKQNSSHCIQHKKSPMYCLSTSQLASICNCLYWEAILVSIIFKNYCILLIYHHYYSIESNLFYFL